jgi:hypothetical protein
VERRRRELMAGFGVALASFLTLGCRPKPPTPIVTCYAALPAPTTPTPLVTCYTVVPVTTPTPVGTPVITCYAAGPLRTVTPTVVAEDQPDWRHLRSLWLDLEGIADVAGDDEEGSKERDRLIAEHQATLARLVAAGVLDEAVAADMQTAYAEAAYHVWRLNANITCYVPAPGPDYGVASRAELLTQAEVLEELATKAALDAATVGEARAAIERDIAYLSMPAEDQQALADRIVAEAGEGGEFPSLEEVEMAVPPASAEAARVLVLLLLGQS